MASQRPSSEHKVLLVEDNPTNLLLVRRILEKAGYEVLVALNGREGVEAARKQTFDLILMDVQMPVLDGRAATEEIRQFSGCAGRVPIIALTASVFAEDSQRCFEAGMDDFVGKPFKAADLVSKCRQWIDRSPTHSVEKLAQALAPAGLPAVLPAVLSDVEPRAEVATGPPAKTESS
jgi:CheY-like chemotaxis protein